MQEKYYTPQYTPPRRRSRHSGGIYKPNLWLLWFPLAALYCEILLRAFTDAPVFFGFGALLGFSFAFGFFIDILCFMLPNRKLCEIIRYAVTVVMCFFFTLEFFMFNSYRVFMDLKSIISGASGVAGEFGDVVKSAIIAGIPKILAMFLPLIAMIILRIFRVRMEVRPRRCRCGYGKSGGLVLICASLLCFVLAFAVVLCTPALSDCYFDWHGFDTTVRSFGLVTAGRLDLKNSVFGGGGASADFVIEDKPQTDTPASTEDPAVTEPSDPGVTTPEEPVVVNYGYNKIDYDFDALIAASSSSDINNIHTYVANVDPSKQSAYTGLFKGKNLIFFTAEAFSAEVIDKDLTPTLYRLANNGFKFTDYYQPAWGGSTSSGEYSLLSGLVPTSGVKSMKATIGKDLSFTIANKLMSQENYYTIAYHNGEYDYYSRNKTHTNFGYSDFIGMGNGMENGVKKVWPESDLEMMQYTLPQYATKEPFCVYYMTVSGHCLYTRTGNNMTKKNWDAVQGLTCSDTVKGYYSANLELEYALKYTVEYLEANGLADDTVIVLGSDHYPYGLEKSDSWGNTEDYLAELYGYPADSNTARDHSALIIWSGCLENENSDLATTIDTPTYSLDVLPTLCNLFGVEYDSRLLVGRDVFSDAEPLVIWMNQSWKTTYGYYNAANGSFTPAEGVTVPDDYVSSTKATVKNKVSYSKSVIATDYFSVLDKAQ